jgi:hypothetical protein
VFDLHNHVFAKRAYAWSYVLDEATQRRRFYAVLHVGAVKSPVRGARGDRGRASQRELINCILTERGVNENLAAHIFRGAYRHWSSLVTTAQNPEAGGETVLGNALARARPSHRGVLARGGAHMHCGCRAEKDVNPTLVTAVKRSSAFAGKLGGFFRYAQAVCPEPRSASTRPRGDRQPRRA